MRFGIANKSIYFNYNYRLECRSRLQCRRSDSLPCSASSAPPPPPAPPPPAAARRLSVSVAAARGQVLITFAAAHAPLLRRIFGQLLKNEMVLHIVMTRIWHLASRIWTYLLHNSSKLGAEKDFHWFPLRSWSSVGYLFYALLHNFIRLAPSSRKCSPLANYMHYAYAKSGCMQGHVQRPNWLISRASKGSFPSRHGDAAVPISRRITGWSGNERGTSALTM